MNGDIAFYAQFQHMDSSGSPLYSLVMLDNSRANPDKKRSSDQCTIADFLAQNSKYKQDYYELTDLLNRVFSATRKVDLSITGKRFYNRFSRGSTPKLYLLVDANLSKPGSDSLNIHFHQTLHTASRIFRDKYSSRAELYVYPFSQNAGTCEKAGRYLNGQMVDGFELNTTIEHGFSADRTVLSVNVKYPELDEAFGQGNTPAEEFFQFSSCCCIPFFNTKTASTVSPVFPTQTVDDKSDLITELPSDDKAEAVAVNLG